MACNLLESRRHILVLVHVDDVMSSSSSRPALIVSGVGKEHDDEDDDDEIRRLSPQQALHRKLSFSWAPQQPIGIRHASLSDRQLTTSSSGRSRVSRSRRHWSLPSETHNTGIDGTHSSTRTLRISNDNKQLGKVLSSAGNATPRQMSFRGECSQEKKKPERIKSIKSPRRRSKANPGRDTVVSLPARNSIFQVTPLPAKSSNVQRPSNRKQQDERRLLANNVSDYLAARAKKVLDKQNLASARGVPNVIFCSERSINTCSTVGTMSSVIEEYSLKSIPSHLLDQSSTLGNLCRSAYAWETYDKFRSTTQNDTKQRASKMATDFQLAHDYSFPVCAGASLWPNHVYTKINSIGFGVDATSPDDNIKSLDVSAIIFSPFALPRAIHVHHLYEVSKAGGHDVFSASWAYRTIYLNPKISNNVKRGPWMTICSVKMQNGNIKHNVLGLSQKAVAKMRSWLVGTTSDLDGTRSGSIMNHFDFLSFVFASTFTPLKPTESNSPLCRHSITRTTNGTGSATGQGSNSFHRVSINNESSAKSQMYESKHSFSCSNKDTSTSWLEYEVRKATGRLRPRDKVQAVASVSQSALDLSLLVQSTESARSA